MLTDSTVTGADPDREAIRTLLVDGLTPDQIATRFGGRRGPWLVAIEEEAKLDRSSIVSRQHQRASSNREMSGLSAGSGSLSGLPEILVRRPSSVGSMTKEKAPAPPAVLTPDEGRRFKEMT